MSQQKLFFDDVYDALRTAVQALGGHKVVGAKLWPEKTADAAGRLLADCLNTSKAEKLAPDQVVVLLKWAREVGCHDAMQYIAAESGYEATPVDPEVQRDRLADSIAQATQTLALLIKAAEKLPPAVRRAA